MTERRATISGTLAVGEANAAVRDLQYRMQGSVFDLYALLIALIAASIVGGYLAVNALFPGENWGAIPGALVGYLLYQRVWRGLFVGRYRKNFAARGLSLDLTMRVDVEPQALVSETGGVKRIVQWPVVTEVFHSHGYWIFLAQGDAIFVPERLFPSKQDEQSFVASALSHMSADARARSTSATVFAGEN